MSRVYGRRDRTARLLKLQFLLHQNPVGLTLPEIANKCLTSTKTAYRDLKALEFELGVPIWEEGRKRGISEGYFLPPIHFTVAEAMSIFLAARLLQNYSLIYNPNITSMFMKIDTILPETLRKQVEDTLDYIERHPKDKRKLINFDKLTRAWLSRQRVKIWYEGLTEQTPKQFIIEPYFIEPSVARRSSYVVAYCHEKKAIRTFKIDQIFGEVIIEPDTYDIPPDFNAIEYINSALDVFTSDEELITAKLRFNKISSRTIKNTIWHHSQKIETQDDGTTIMTLRIRNSLGFLSWILGWTDTVEVLEPKALRIQIAGIGQSLVNLYSNEEGIPPSHR